MVSGERPTQAWSEPRTTHHAITAAPGQSFAPLAPIPSSHHLPPASAAMFPQPHFAGASTGPIPLGVGPMGPWSAGLAPPSVAPGGLAPGGVGPGPCPLAGMGGGGYTHSAFMGMPPMASAAMPGVGGVSAPHPSFPGGGYQPTTLVPWRVDLGTIPTIEEAASIVSPGVGEADRLALVQAVRDMLGGADWRSLSSGDRTTALGMATQRLAQEDMLQRQEAKERAE